MGNSYYWLFIGDNKLTVDIQLIIESHITHFDYTWIQLVVDGTLGRRNSRRRRRGRGRRLQPNVWTSPLLQTLGLWHKVCCLQVLCKLTSHWVHNGPQVDFLQPSSLSTWGAKSIKIHIVHSYQRQLAIKCHWQSQLLQQGAVAEQ